ncbi:MAG: hypothetical protein ACREDZ_02135 [Kiloniellales bacterium]
MLIQHVGKRPTIDPSAWVAPGDPAEILPPDRHEAIWAIQKPLNFPEWVYGFDRATPELLRRVNERLSEALGAHGADHVVEER